MTDSTPSGLNELELLNLDSDTGEAPESRLKDVAAAVAIYGTLRRADERSSANRARIDGMFDGAPPYDQRVLQSTGQGSRTNLNLGEAQRFLDVAMSAYVDLYSSLERLVSVKLRGGEPVERQEAQDIVSEELTNALREWPEFHSSYLRLCGEFTKHGVSVAYFDSPKGWKFRVCGFGDFLIPRQTVASEEGIEVACARRQYLLHELYGFIRDESVAADVGWDVEEVKRVITKNARTTGRTGTTTFSDWEATQRELKNNDLYTGLENTTVQVLHFWVREFNGTVSHFICAEEGPKSFMFRKTGMFSAPEQAYVLFSYGVGSNGTYHSVRGLGHRIFNHVQTSNRLRCQMIDGAMLSSGVMIQPESQRALEDLSFTFYGPYSVLSPNVRIVEKAIPNLSNSVVPALSDLQNQLAQNVDLLSTYGPGQSSPYRNNLQVEHDLAVASRLSGSTLNLFYASWNRLLREVVRRFVSGDRKDKAVASFYQRCAERGVSAAMIKTLDAAKTTAVKAIGAGSQANRLLALRELNGISGSFDDVGRRNLIRDITATRVGYDLVDRYAPASPEPRLTVDAKIALMENQSMRSGVPVPVLDSELHGMHLRVHAPELQALVAAIDSGEADPVAALPLVQALYEHCTQHAQFLSSDPAARAELAEIKQLLQIAQEVLTNTGRKIMKMQRDAAQQGAAATAAAAPEGAQGPTQAELKMQEHQLKMDIARQKAELDMRIREAKFQQEQALRDADKALSLGGR
jgi:hypothetical protein